MEPEKTPTDNRVTCVHCKRSRPRRLMNKRDDEHYECNDIVECSEATQWATN